MYLAFILLLSAPAASAAEQGRATLSGRVYDPSEAIVPGVAVRVSNAATGEVFEAETDRQGAYSVSLLRPGTYDFAVHAGGFKPYTKTGIALQAGQRLWMDAALEVAEVSSAITVKAAPLESAFEHPARNFEEALEMREVRESSARDVGEALTRLDGVWKIRKGGIANDVLLRGFQQDNVNVLIDGARIHGACPNRMDPPASHVDFAEIQEVEVVKGAFDIRNQGGLGGLVNIVTKNPARGLRVTPNFSAGSFGYFNPSLTGSVSNGKYYGLGGYSFRRSDPFVDGAGRPFTAYANYRDTIGGASAFDIGTGWFKFGAAPAESQRFEFGYTRQNGGRTLYPYLQMDALYDNADRLNAQYHVDGLWNVVKQLRVQSYFSRVKHWMTDELRTSSLGAARPFTMASFAATRSLGGRAEAEFTNLVIGVEANRRNWNVVNTMRMAPGYTDQPSIPDVYTADAGAFADYRRMLFGKLLLSAGLRVDTAASAPHTPNLNTDLYWAYKATRSLSTRDTNPSGKLWLAYSLPAGVELFAGVGHTVRLPDPRERYMALKRGGTDWVGNPELRPTQNTEADFGFNLRHSRFTLRPTVFYSHLANFVTVQNQPRLFLQPGVMNASARSYENVNARMWGGEMSYSVAVTRALLVSGGLSRVRASKDPRPYWRIFDRNVAEIPATRSRLAVRYGNKRFFGEVEGIASGAQNRVDYDLREARTAGYGLLNAKFGIHANRINFAAGLDNAFNRYYYEHFSFQRDPFRTGQRVPEPGRALYMTVSYGF